MSHAVPLVPSERLAKWAARAVGVAFAATVAIAAFWPLVWQPAMAIHLSSKAMFEQIKGNILKSVDKLPEEKFSFRPTPEVRTYGQLLAHVADGQYIFCGLVKEGKVQMKGIEKSATSKAQRGRVASNCRNCSCSLAVPGPTHHDHNSPAGSRTRLVRYSMGAESLGPFGSATDEPFHAT